MLSAARVRALQGALFLATLLLFCRSLGNGFLDYDDPDYVTDNAHVQAGLSWAGARWALTSGEAANWHPLTWMSHMLDWRLFGAHPMGHHATSIVIHALNAVLAFAVLRRLTGRTWAAAFSAALFAWHPLRVESVSWVAERKDVLSVFFGLLTLLAYGAYAARRRRGGRGLLAYAGVLAAFGAGLMCKPMLVTMPFVLLLLDFWPLRRLDFRMGWGAGAGGGRGNEARAAEAADVRATGRAGAPDIPRGTPEFRPWAELVAEKIPLFLLTAASCVVTYHVQKAGSAVVDGQPLQARLGNAVVSVARYIGVIVWPSNLTIAYPLPAHWPILPVIGGILVCILGTGLALTQFGARPWIAVGWFWFLGALMPVIGLVQVGMQAMADRYTYLPSLGLEIAGVWTVAQWASTAGRRQAATAGAVVVLACCAALTWRQQGFWRSPRTLYTHALDIAPDNYLAQGYMGSYLLNAKDPAGAEGCFRRSIALNPEYALARYRLGLALKRQNRSKDAIAVYRDLLVRRPRYAMGHYGLGLLLMEQGDLQGAAEHLKAALRPVSPASLWVDYGTVEERRGQGGEAADAFQQALEREPDNANAHFGLAVALEDLGRPDEALAQYVRAAQCDPQSAQARYNIGTLLYEKGFYVDAGPAFAAAVGLRPGYADAWVGLGLVDRKLGRTAEAVAHLERGLKLKSGIPGVAGELAAARKAAAASGP